MTFVRRLLRYLFVLVLVGLLPDTAAFTQNRLASDAAAAIDRAVTEILASTGTPSASIAVVQDGTIAYLQAHGKAQLEPARPATVDMRYSIGSISKQFTAAAILLLAEDGTLSLDDPVGRWLPDLTRANEVTVRQLLSMTSGYQDFWPQDYVMPGMLKDVAPEEILREWARKPLDFDPGTRWQYSNTNYVAAGLIAERAAGKPLFDLLQERIFRPLQMMSVFNSDQSPLPPGDPMRHLRFALGPPRPAPREGRGWMFAAGELAMTARDLATWDISMIRQTVLRPDSYRALQTETLLKNGAPTGYGLGVTVAMPGGRRQISHTGEVSGFTARNDVYPEEAAAVVVLTNLDATGASSQIAARMAPVLFNASGVDAQQAVDQARAIFEGLQHGRIDRALFTSNTNAYFTDQALKDFETSLGPLGKPTSFTQASRSLRGGMVARRFQIIAGGKTLSLTTFTMPDGKIEQYQVAE